MNNPAIDPAPQPATNIQAAAPLNDPPDDPNDFSSMPHVVTSDSWDSENESSDEDGANESDESGVGPLADESFWEEDTAADAWLAKHPGGSRLLYPHLFVIKPRGGKVVTPSYNPKRTCFLFHLPPEIRNQIYKHCFDGYGKVKRPEEDHAPFRDRDGREIQKIYLSSEDVELKFWLSNALLQTSRQLRFEAMPVLFENRVITVEWLPVLPRFVEFLGKKGCFMVRYLDIWDTLNFQGHESDRYRDIIMSISHFSRLQHLRIVLSWGILSDRTRSWFDASEWTHDGDLKEHAIPKMRSEAVKSHWPEYEVLKNLKAQNCTLAVESVSGVDRYIEFNRNYGAYPGITKSMQFYPAPKELAPSPAPVSTSSISSEVFKTFEAIETQPRSRASTSSSEYEDSDSPTWQDTDTLVNKTIPLYNFLREFFHNNIYLRFPEGRLREIPVQNLVTFPTARKSTGSIMRDCAFCYLSERHCGHHAVPDQPPFEPKRLGGDGVNQNVKMLEKQFEDLSYIDMREACRSMVQHVINVPETPDLLKALTVFDYLHWFEMPISERLIRLDTAVEVGWAGKRVDKEEVPPWDMLYREIVSCFDLHKMHLCRVVE